MATGNNVYVVTKNGNFKKVVGDRAGAIATLRKLAADDLKIKNIANLPEMEKNGVIAITGVAHWRAKAQPVE